LTPPLRLAVRLAALALLGCAAAPPVPLPAATAGTETNPPKSDPLPVNPLPVPAIVIVQSPPSTPPASAMPPAPTAAPSNAQVATVQPTLTPPVNEEDQQALALLADLQRYASDPADDLKRELAGASAAFARTRSDANRIRVAMLLTLPAAGPPDDARALTLLEPLAKGNSGTSPLKQIASVLYAQIVERTRSLREEQKRTAAAQEKLDALRAVERSLLLERSRNAGGGAGGGGGGTGR
jgi:hypothetical protein